MSKLGDARAAILAALEAAGVRAATSGRHSAPVVILEPGEPWSAPQSLPRRSSRWQLTAIAGAGDADAAQLELAELVDRVDTALRTIDGCGYPTWGKPADRTFGDVSVPTTLGTFTMALE